MGENGITKVSEIRITQQVIEEWQDNFSFILVLFCFLQPSVLDALSVVEIY